MSKRIRVVGSAAAILAVLLVALTGSAAAVSMTEETTITNYSDSPVSVRDAPDLDWDNEGYVEVDVSGAAITDGNVTLVGEDGTTLSDLESGTDAVYVGSVNKTQINNNGGSYAVDVQVDGVTEATVFVEISASDAVESDVVNGSEIRNANSINVTVDSDALTDTDDLSRLQSDDTYDLAFHADGFRFVIDDFDPSSINGTTTVDLTSESLVLDERGNVTDGEKRIYAAESVESIEIDGEVVYDEGAFGATTGDGNTPVMLIIAALVVVGLLALRD